MSTLNAPPGIIALLMKMAAVDGEICKVERQRIQEIAAALQELDQDAALPPLTVLNLLFDVAVADGQLHEHEASFLAEIAAASDSLELSLTSFREGWAASADYHERVRRVGLFTRGDVLRSMNGSYALGHAVVDICSALRRQGSMRMKVQLREQDRAVLVTAARAAQHTQPSLPSILGLRDGPIATRGLLTRSTAALELHIAAAGGIVAETTTILALSDSGVTAATAFGTPLGQRRMSSATSLEWAYGALSGNGHDIGVLLEGVGKDGAVGWTRRAFDEILRQVDERLHRWGARDCPGGECSLHVMSLKPGREGVSDPFRGDALPRNVLRRFVEPRPGLLLDARVHRLMPVPLALARRVSANEDMVEQCGTSPDGLLQGIPAPGIYLYDEVGRCILREHVPHDMTRFVSERRAPEAIAWLETHRIRIDVLERPAGMQSIDCLNFSALWQALLR